VPFFRVESLAGGLSGFTGCEIQLVAAKAGAWESE